MDAKIIAISISRVKGQKKTNIPEEELVVNHGIEGDAQLSLLGIESIELMRKSGADVNPGDFAENITVEGLTLFQLPVGTKLALGKTIVEVTQIGKECHQGCEIMQQVGSCIMPTQGIFGRVLEGGKIQVGDAVRIVEEPVNA